MLACFDSLKVHENLWDEIFNDTLRKICDTTGFPRPIFSRITTEAMILFLHEKIGIRGNPYSVTFHAMAEVNSLWNQTEAVLDFVLGFPLLTLNK